MYGITQETAYRLCEKFNMHTVLGYILQLEDRIKRMRNCQNCNQKFCTTQPDAMGYRDLVQEAHLSHECQGTELAHWELKS